MAPKTMTDEQKAASRFGWSDVSEIQMLDRDGNPLTAEEQKLVEEHMTEQADQAARDNVPAAGWL